MWQHPLIRRLCNTLALTVAIYGFAAWVYVAVVAVALPQTLSWQLTHFARWPRTDTFGELSFAASIVGFIVYRLTRVESPPGRPESVRTSDPRGLRES